MPFNLFPKKVASGGGGGVPYARFAIDGGTIGTSPSTVTIESTSVDTIGIGVVGNVSAMTLPDGVYLFTVLAYVDSSGTPASLSLSFGGAGITQNTVRVPGTQDNTTFSRILPVDADHMGAAPWSFLASVASGSGYFSGEVQLLKLA